ncbi:5'-AMP-activated protein kinase beta subunit, interation domain-domain-containing protein [Syncephalastrum racemosum]|uniref:5'-AMP-activated protein kinase beta subunit, interation domain-domain-containing protein n=1 Tax=Syncephalastrum racemosum TaxID=13706 RepID=A0A1X2HWN9_SYNRA|nr:5'-AMP-activated protein kinase beta subunit, interation domain-domain-containing protein [Syncephalastrum racemosum]
MGNTASKLQPEKDNNDDRNDTVGSYTFEKPAAPPAVTATSSSSSSSSTHSTSQNNNSTSKQQHHPHSRVPFRLSVTGPPPPPQSSEPVSATSTTSDTFPEFFGARPPSPSPNASANANANAIAPHEDKSIATSKAVPVAPKKSGWVSSTGASSPWYGSLSSSASSTHQRSDSVRGPYYRTRGMSVTHTDNEDDPLLQHLQQQQQQQQQQQSISRRLSSRGIAEHSRSNGVPTIITWAQGGQNVYVTGTFNGWKHKIKLVKSTQDFTAVLDLPPGTHRLKFIVDDEWKCSNEMETATDPDGNLVNYLQVMNEDDEFADEFGDSRTEPDTSSRASSPTEEYTSEIPADLLALAAALAEDESGAMTDAGRQAAAEWEQTHAQPPALPPHLDKVLLNHQSVSEEDNSVLPEPNHVTLNHLYACSIKDNVMALSTTTRYRKKYVTTMYYRPVAPKQ